ncbi:MAG: hypothetical protein JWR10_1986 [Rubritepida sp.]|nr:hypothetical protein [Rubritepida sp.]
MQPGAETQSHPSVAADHEHQPPHPADPRYPLRYLGRRAPQQDCRPARQPAEQRRWVRKAHRVAQQPGAGHPPAGAAPSSLYSMLHVR